MKNRTAGLFLIAAMVSGCSGTNTLPYGQASVASAVPSNRSASKDDVRTFVRIRVPRRRRKHDVHPSTISPLTQSVTIQVGTARAQTFNTTPSSPGCTIGSKGTTCTLAVSAPSGTDTFAVTTFGGANASGTALDRGIATVPISKGKANHVAVTLGPVVSTTADNGVGSLRYAIASASPGDTILFLLATGSAIALASPVTILGSVTIAGPGATKLAITGGSKHQLFLVNGNATISGLTLTHGKAATPGAPGGIIDNAGSVTLASDIVGSSTSVVAALRRARRTKPPFDAFAHRLHPHTCTPTVSEGGAVYNTGALVTNHTQFLDNAAESNTATCINGEGGAIYNDVTGSLSSTDDTFSGNAAVSGGAVFNASLGVVTFNADLFDGNTGCTDSTGCPTFGCAATGCTSNASGAGAAIADDGLGITVLNSTFKNNVAGGSTPGSIGAGGALYLVSGTPTITNDIFTGNVAGGGTSSCSMGIGGAIAAAVPVELDNDAFENNAAKGDGTSSGGAVAAEVGSVTGTGDTFEGNAVVASGGNCTATSEAAGGAVVAVTGATFDNTKFTGNSVTAGSIAVGGAVYTGTAILNTDTFTSNKALGNGGGAASTTSAAGGAVVGSTLIKIGGSTFTSNAATVEGPKQSLAAGGAVVLTSGAFASGGSTFTSNAVSATSNDESVGGAVAVLAGTLASSGDKFTSNTVKGTVLSGGGAMYVEAGSVIGNTTISSNSVSGGTDAFGGGLAIGPSGTLTNVTVTGNSTISTATGAMGGGIFDAGGASIAGSAIVRNTAGNSGGGIASIGSHVETLIDTNVSDNAVTHASAANSGGGGIYETSGLVLGDSTVSGNTVATSGTGPAGGGGIFDGASMLAAADTISANAVTGTAPGGGGGILDMAGFSLVDATIESNTTSKDGGGVDIDSNNGELFANVTLYKNGATGRGGNINNLFASTQLTNSVVADGTAAAGLDIYNAGTIASGDYNIVQTAVGGNALSGTTMHDKTANPELLALADNGGATFTSADRAASPGRAYIPFAGGMCGSFTMAQDQRGYARGAGGKCDVGAYEYAGVASANRHRTMPTLRNVKRAPYTTRMMPIMPRSSWKSM